MSVKINLHNHLTGQSEQIAGFNKILGQTDKSISMYVCGPTVHAVSHIGHGRTFAVFDSLRKFLTSKGTTVNFGMNITDIDDKINAKVRTLHYNTLLQTNLSVNQLKELEDLMLQKVTEGVFNQNDMTPSMELYYKFVNDRSTKFWEELKSINVNMPTTCLRVSEVLPQIEDMITKLIEKGYAYESNGSVYFNTNYYYGKFCRCPLSNSTEDDINVKDGYTSEKINPQDFALWKKAKPYSIGFLSKFSFGSPGWHIECSVMSSIMFGDNIDLHGGGIDLKFPHHHNEVLQSNSYFEKPNVFKHFMYTGHIRVNGEKMAQSVGNYLTLEQYLSRYSANSMRLLFWSVYWARPMELSDDTIEYAVALEKRISEFISTIEFNLKLHKNIPILNNDISIQYIYSLFDKIDEVLSDEFRTDEAIRLLGEIITNTHKAISASEIDNTILEHILNKTKGLLYIIGLNLSSYDDDKSNESEQFLHELNELRKLLKNKKQYDISDYVRDVVFPRLGYLAQDTPDGVKISKTKAT